MIELITYRADDGKTFNSKEECTKYEQILSKVNAFLSIVPDPIDFDISNGQGYILHEKGTASDMEELLVNLSNIWFKEKFTGFCYILGRYIDDSDMKCLNRLSYRLMCFSGDREYGQPYFANNPSEADNIQVNNLN